MSTTRRRPAFVLLMVVGAVVGLACENSEEEPPTDLDPSTLQTALAGAASVRPACEVLTADSAQALVAEGLELEQQDEGDFCAYASLAGDDSLIVFELMTPFGEQLFDLESSDTDRKKSVSGVGEKAYTAETDEGTVLWAHANGVFLRLEVARPASDALVQRMTDFAAAALTD